MTKKLRDGMTSLSIKLIKIVTKYFSNISKLDDTSKLRIYSFDNNVLQLINLLDSQYIYM